MSPGAFVPAVRGEIAKLVALPGLRIGVAVSGALPPLAAWLNRRTISRMLDDGRASEMVRDNLVDTGFLDLMPGIIIAVLVGVLAMSSEHRVDRSLADSGHQLATSLLVVPGRRLLVAAKATAVAVATGACWAVVGGPTLLVARSGLGRWAPALTWGDGWRLVGSLLYWVLMAELALAVVIVVRSGVLPLALLVANSVTVSFSYLLTHVTPWARYLPDLAGTTMFLRNEPLYGERLPPVVGGLVMAAWAAGGLALATAVFQRRDP